MLSKEAEAQMEHQYAGEGLEVLYALAKDLAEVHCGDGDELGWMANKLLALLKKHELQYDLVHAMY